MATEQTLPNVATADEAFAPRKHPAFWKTWLKFARRKPLGAFGMIMALVLLLLTLGTPTGDFNTDELNLPGPLPTVAVPFPELPDSPLVFTMGAPWFQRYGPEEVFYNEDDRNRAFEDPSSNHWLGTDGAGRDNWSRLVNGARRSLYVALWALAIATIIGTAIGVASGYFGRWMDTSTQRIMDALQSFPPLIALILVISVNPLTDSPNLLVIALALGIVGIPSVQRIVRGVVLSTREQQYVDSARVIGASDARTMRYYILPNIMASIIVVFSTGLGVAILAESALGFIAPDKLPIGPSWGVILGDNQNEIKNNPWPGLTAAGAIVMAVLGFNLAGDALRDVLDPRLRL